MLDAAVATAPGVFARLARRFDLSILGQPEPEQPALDRLIVEAALFDSGRPDARRSLHTKKRSQA